MSREPTSSATRNPGDETYPGYAVVRLDGGLFFATAEALDERVRTLVQDADPPLRGLVLDMESVDFVDSQGAAMLAEILDFTESAGVRMGLARVKPAVAHVLGSDGVLDRLGPDRVHGSLPLAIDAQLAADRDGSADGRAEAEPVGDQPVAEAAVAHDERVAPELRQHRAHDAGAREDHLGAVGLEPDDRAPLLGGPRAVQLDLPVDRGPVEPGALDGVRVVHREAELDGREVRHGAAHPDEHLGRGAAVEAVELGGDPPERVAERVLGHGPVEPVALRQADRADRHAELLGDDARRRR